MKMMWLPLGLVAIAISCSTTPPTPTAPQQTGPSPADYLLRSGSYKAEAMVQTDTVKIPALIEIERSCAEREGVLTCENTVKRTFNGASNTYVARNVVRDDGIYDAYFKDAERNIETTTESLRLPALSRLPYEWSYVDEDITRACKATTHKACTDGIAVVCEGVELDGTLRVNKRVFCPDQGKRFLRRSSTFSTRCETLNDVVFRWADKPAEPLEAARPKRCERVGSLGWIRQTPNRDWSVGMPGKGRMVLGPDKWTVNLHQEVMSFIAYEGTGPNANVQTDVDIPLFVEQMEASVGALLKVTAGEPIKRKGKHAVDWEVPLIDADGKFAGAFRFVGQKGRMFSLMAAGNDEKQAREFLESLEINSQGLGAQAVTEWDQYIEAGGVYKKSVCECKTMDCIRNVTELIVPRLGFPTAEQEGILAALSDQINACAATVLGPSGGTTPPTSP